MSKRLLALIVASIFSFAAPASANEFADPSTPGPALSVPTAELQNSLTCSAGVVAAAKTPILLVHGTSSNPDENWSWTYVPALDQLGIPWCHIEIPDKATGDVQRNGEFVVHAIRDMHSRAGRKISIIGHSQGGMLPRWALRFWPDTRGMVDDLIGFAPSNHGTDVVGVACADESCPAAHWQQWTISNFIRALNSYAETWAGISYTNIYTKLDELVQPNLDDSGRSSLHTGEGRINNVATQDVCPNDTYEHLGIGTVDPVAYALAIDALNNDGPAVESRIPATVCLQRFHPGINQATVAQDIADALSTYLPYRPAEVDAEPDLACYTLAAGCAKPEKDKPAKEDKPCKDKKQIGSSKRKTSKRKASKRKVSAKRKKAKRRSKTREPRVKCA